MPSCLSCGATAYPESSTCEYCGSALELETVATATVGADQRPLDQAMSLLQCLRNRWVTPSNSTLLQLLWWILAILTLGLVLLFWKRPGSVPSVYRAATENLRFLARAAARQANDHDRAKLRFINEEVDQLEAEVKAARKRSRRALAAAVAILLVLSAIGRATEKEETSNSDGTTTSQSARQ